MRKWAKRLAAVASALLAGLVIAGAVFLAMPGALLTGRTAGAAIKLFGKSYAPRWSSLRFSASAIARRRHRYVLSASDVCVGDRPGVFSACFSGLELSAVVFYTRRGPVVERVERLVAVADDARLNLRRRDPRAGAGGLPAALLATPVQALRVELSSFTVSSSKAVVFGAFRAVLMPGVPRPLSVAADVRIQGSSGAGRLKADLTAATDLLQGGTPTFVDLAGRADLGPRGRARAALRVRREPRRYVASGSAEIASPGGPVRNIRLTACAGSAPLAPGASRPSSAEFACRYELVPAKLTLGRFGSIKSATGRASLSGRVDGRQYQAALKADLEPITAWYEFSGNLAVRIAGRVDRPLKEAAVSHELRAAAKAARFEDLVAFLRETKYAVPAPVHVLKGPLSLALVSRGDPRSARPAAHYAFSCDLAGTRQRLVLRAAGDVAAVNAWTPARSFEHTGELTLKEVALEVPRLDVVHTPKVFVDKRIKTGEEEPAPAAPKEPALAENPRPLPFRGSLLVKTEKPLILFSNLAKDPVPLALGLNLTYPPAVAAGQVAVQRFDVELFRRNATVDHLNVALSSGSKSGALEGLVLYKTPAVEIRILVLGTTEKPRIELTSVPALKREDIIALLIFGKSPAELDSEQTASVGNTQTALESRAFGLASLYLFGATPIEQVGYDSATKTTTVKLRLPGGVNLTLGSDFDQSRQLTVRKPLAPHWAIQSELTDQGQQGKAATTFLEWFNRY
jgi:hypothetical protein